MIIDCISDLHGYQPKLPGGDLLLVAGDMTARDQVDEWKSFYDWLHSQKYRQIIYIGGNHDSFLENSCSTQESRKLGLVQDPSHVEYLKDNFIIFEGLKIYGFPWTPTFCSWHFMKDPGQPMREMVELIPNDIDILISHGPPLGILDSCPDFDGLMKNAGSKDLAKKMPQLKDLKLHVFGHIHEGYGYHRGKYLSINASLMNGDYIPLNKPYRVRLEETPECRWEEIPMDSQSKYPVQLE